MRKNSRIGQWVLGRWGVEGEGKLTRHTKWGRGICQLGVLRWSAKGLAQDPTSPSVRKQKNKIYCTLARCLQLYASWPRLYIENYRLHGQGSRGVTSCPTYWRSWDSKTSGPSSDKCWEQLKKAKRCLIKDTCISKPSKKKIGKIGKNYSDLVAVINPIKKSK